MKKYVYVTMILTAFLLQGCDKDDGTIRTGRGEILHNGYTYQLYHAERFIRKANGISNQFTRFDYYFLPLILTGAGDVNARIIVRSKSDRLESGEFHVRVWTVDNQLVFASGGHLTYFPPVENRPDRIMKEINLSDDFVHFAHNFGPSPKRMKLSVTEEGDIFDIELRYVECEGNFLIRYRGVVRDRGW